MNTIEFIQQQILAIGSAGKCDIFTDGGCEPNPGHGGFGVVVVLPFGGTLELFGGDVVTTNNRMEMLAVLQALRCLPPGWAADIHSDSKYVVQGISSWVPGWKKNGWKRRPGRGHDRGGLQVKNVDLWMALDAEPARKRCRFKWLKGHAGHEHNERADRLAALGRQEFIDGKLMAVEISAQVITAPPAPMVQQGLF